MIPTPSDSKEFHGRCDAANHRDYLGNTRMRFSDLNPSIGLRAGGNGVAEKSEILQEWSYYPFGLTFEGLGAPSVGTLHREGFNGKELESEFGLGWNDFGARRYDAALGRWCGVDALGERYAYVSPYVAFLDNPVLYVDPDGRKITIYYIDQEGKRTKVQIRNEAELKAATAHSNNFVRHTSIAIFQGYTGGYSQVVAAVHHKENVDITYLRGRTRYVDGESEIEFDPAVKTPVLSLEAAFSLYMLQKNDEYYQKWEVTTEEIEEAKEFWRNKSVPNLFQTADEKIGHELGHWLHEIENAEAYYERKSQPAGIFTTQEEVATIAEENLYLKAKGKPSRLHHIGAKGKAIFEDLKIDNGEKNK